MILVEAFWEDQNGTAQTARARMEDKSVRGACIRVKTPIRLGSKLRIQWRFEQFSGIVKYCRGYGCEYLVGIEKDNAYKSTFTSIPKATPSQPNNADFRNSDQPNWTAPIQVPAKTEDSNPGEFPVARQKADSQPGAIPGTAARRTLPRGFVRIRAQRERHRSWRPQQAAQPPAFNARQIQLHTKQPSTPGEAGKETKHMGLRWLNPATWHAKHDDFSARHDHKGASDKENLMPDTTQPTEKDAGGSARESSAREVPTFEVELLSTEEIYRAAGIITPRKGYGVNKVVEMLNSSHVRGLAKEMKRAAVLMALDAAGVTLDHVQRDAKARQEALDAYEAEQKRQAEAEWARKAEAVTKIQAELESIKAHYTARINRNLEGIAREKARFNNWVMAKQQEVQSILEAVELCSKPPAPEAASSPAAATSAGARA